MSHAHPLPAGEFFDVAALPRGEPVTGVILRDLGARPVYELRSAKGVRLVDATSGELVHVDEQMARDVGSLMNEAPIRKVSVLAKPNLESRDHDGAMWRVDFADAENRSAYVSLDRSEERRVGKECVSTCRSRWSPYTKKNKINNTRR